MLSASTNTIYLTLKLVVNLVHRMYQQRVITAAIIAVLIILIVIILWEKLS